MLSNVVFGILLIFTGANIPADRTPPWMDAIGACLPFTHAIEAARELADGVPFADVTGLVLTELGIGTIYFVAGYAIAARARAREPTLRDAGARVSAAARSS